MRLFCLMGLFALMLSGQNVPTKRGTDLGNAGDKIREIFHDARYVAADMAGDRDDLRNELIFTNHIWSSTAPKHRHCSDTKPASYEAINLYYDNCRHMSLTSAAKELLKQALVHVALAEDEARLEVDRLFKIFESTPEFAKLKSIKEIVSVEKLKRIDVRDIAGTYQSENKFVPQLLLDESGEMTWPLVSAYDDQTVTLSIGQFLMLQDDSNLFEVTGQFKYKANAAANGVARRCAATVKIILAPNRDVTQLKISYIRPAILSPDCKVKGEVIESVTMLRIK